MATGRGSSAKNARRKLFGAPQQMEEKTNSLFIDVKLISHSAPASTHAASTTLRTRDSEVGRSTQAFRSLKRGPSVRSAGQSSNGRGGANLLLVRHEDPGAFRGLDS